MTIEYIKNIKAFIFLEIKMDFRNFLNMYIRTFLSERIKTLNSFKRCTREAKG